MNILNIKSDLTPAHRCSTRNPQDLYNKTNRTDRQRNLTYGTNLNGRLNYDRYLGVYYD